MGFIESCVNFAVDEIGVVNAIVRTMLQNSVKENHATSAVMSSSEQ